jgi:hypothetical protein
MRIQAASRPWALFALGWLLAASCGCVGPHEASRDALASSFEPYRSRTIGSVDIETFLRVRTAMLVGGPAAIVVEGTEQHLSGHTRFRSAEPAADGQHPTYAALGAAVSLSADGYFLTVAHPLAAGPTHVVLEAGGQIHCVLAREVWSDAQRDVALIHAELRPDEWFELAPDRALHAGEVVLSFSHSVGPAAGKLDVPVDLPSLGTYAAVAIPHDSPLLEAHSGAAAMTLDGHLLGVQTRAAVPTPYQHRSWLVHERPDALRKRMDDDRRARGQVH